MSLDSKILQILDSSACLSKGQLSGYLSRSLYPEELRAVELHLSECPFCSDALDGLEQEQDAQKTLGNIDRLPVLPPPAPRESRVEAVLDKVVKTVTPRTQHDPPVPAKSNIPEGPATAVRNAGIRPRSTVGWWKPLGIAAGLFTVVAVLWYLRPENNDDHKPEGYIAENRSLQVTDAQPAETGSNTTAAITRSQPPAVSKSTLPKPDSAALKPKKALAARDTVVLRTLATESKIAAKEENTRQASGTARITDAASDAGNAETLRATPDAAANNAKAELAAKNVADKEEESATDRKRAAKQDNKMSDYEMGVELYKQKQYGSALLYLKPAQRNAADPRHYDAVYYSALCYKNSGQKKKAVQLLKKLVEEGAPQKSSAQKQLKELGED